MVHSKDPVISQLHMGGSVVRVSDSWPGGCEFDIRLRHTFLLAYYQLTPLKYVTKVVGGFGKKIV